MIVQQDMRVMMDFAEKLANYRILTWSVPNMKHVTG